LHLQSFPRFGYTKFSSNFLLMIIKFDEFFVRFLGWFENDRSIFLGMEYFPLGDLGSCLTAPALENDAKIITAQLLKGLALMHENGCTHRDLKPQV
jgi:serine/threonine protein kinase